MAAPEPVVRELEDVAEVAEAGRLLARVWDSEPEDVMPVNLLKALAHSGNYVAGAWIGSSLVGASAAWVWGPGRPPALHSHITGVDPSMQGRGVGMALKAHQASWARDRGIDTVTWTFDPMVRRNGWFNLTKLGAVAVSYHPDFYGEMPDGVNAGELTDRCFVEWSLSGPPAPPAGRPAARPAGATVLLAEVAHHEPDVRHLDGPLAGSLLCQVPSDGMALRRKDPLLGRRWRLALRRTMGEAMAAGYTATGMTDDGYYLLEAVSR